MKKSSRLSVSVPVMVFFLTAVLATVGCASYSWAREPGITTSNSLSDNMINAAHLGISADEHNRIVQIEAAQSGGITRDTVRECLQVVMSVAKNRKKLADNLNDKADKLPAGQEADAQSLKRDALLVSNGAMEKQMEELCADLAAKAPWYSPILYGNGWYDSLKKEILGK